MSLLLDTHVLLWALYDSSKLSPAAKEAISSSSCAVSIHADCFAGPEGTFCAL